MIGDLTRKVTSIFVEIDKDVKSKLIADALIQVALIVLWLLVVMYGGAYMAVELTGDCPKGSYRGIIGVLQGPRGVLWGDVICMVEHCTLLNSPVQKHLDKRGPGVHHLAFEVQECQAAIDGMTAIGAPMIDKVPAPGAHDCRVAFVHPKGMDGVLCELVEDPHHG